MTGILAGVRSEGGLVDAQDAIADAAPAVVVAKFVFEWAVIDVVAAQTDAAPAVVAKFVFEWAVVGVAAAQTDAVVALLGVGR